MTCTAFAHNDMYGTFELKRTSEQVSVKFGGHWVDRTVWSWDEDECTTREFVLIDGLYHEISGSGPVREVAVWEPAATPCR